MIKEWLAQLGIAAFDESRDAFRISVEQGPEILLEKEVGDWLMAVRVGACPSYLSQGKWLVLLQINGPFSPMAPFHLTVDTAGEILLWVRIPESEMDVGLLNTRYQALQEYYAYLYGFLYKDEQADSQDLLQVASGSVQFV